MFSLLFAGLMAVSSFNPVDHMNPALFHLRTVAPVSSSQVVRVPISDAQALLLHLNSVRASVHRESLQVDETLTALAQADARDMVTHRYFSHYAPDGRSLADRIQAAKYACEYAGENIAMAGSESAAYAALLHSPEHLSNMLSSHYKRVGIGVAAAPDGVLLFVQEFSD